MNFVEAKFIKWLFVLFALKQLVWVAFIPPWQFPDEQAHFAQVQNIAERKNIQPFPGPNTTREVTETEFLLGTRRDGFGNNLFTYHPEFKLPSIEKKVREIEKKIREFPFSFRNERVMYEATVYPPLYYIFAVIPYFLVYGQDILSRIFTVRLINLPIFLLNLYFIYKSGKLLFRQVPFLSVVLLLLSGFHPMFSYVSAGTTSDNLYNLLGTLTLYLGIKFIHEGWNFRWLVSVIVTSIMLWWTKPQAKLLLLIYGISIILTQKSGQLKRNLLIISSIIVIALGYSAINLVTGRQFLPEIPGLAVFSQKYLSLLTHFKWTLTHTYREVMPWYWGVFRWLSLTYPRIAHRIINWVVLFSLIGLIRFLMFSKKASEQKKYIWFLIIAQFLYFFGLFAFDYLFTRAHGYSFGIQGRYYFPLLLGQMTLYNIGLFSLTKGKWRISLVGIIGLGMVVLHTYAQWFVVSSYLTPTSISAFFIQASHYKPVFFKSPYLEILTVIYLVGLLVCLWYYVKVWRLAYYEKKTDT